MKNILFLLMAAAALGACNSPKTETTETTGTTEATAEPKPVEIADQKYIDIGKRSLTQLAQGNVDGFVADYADDAKFFWSAGDSLANKEAISTYWKERRANVIDTITFEDEIWLPVKVNQGPPEPGSWLLNWAKFSVRYSNGKTIDMWIHHVFRFDNNDKIVMLVQYVDRAPIQAALAKK